MINCMIIEFGKSKELHAVLGLKLLLRQLPQLPQWYSYTPLDIHVQDKLLCYYFYVAIL